MEQTGHLLKPDGTSLAWAHLPGKAPTIVFLPGFHSDMAGSKALAVLDFCRCHGQAMLRLDYSGHGASGGAFEEGSIGQWTEDARAIIEHRIDGAMILVGSSMVLNQPIALDAPVRLLQGQCDPDVPWETAVKLASRLTSDNVQIVLIKDGDHRLSRPSDLALLTRTLGALLRENGL